MRRIVIVILGLLLGACASAGPRDHQADAEWAATPPAPPAPPPATPGAIYQAGYEMSLFQDQKARNVGDILTVVLVERTNARSSASTSTKKDSSTAIAAPTILGQGVTLNGKNLLEADLSGAREFKGEGDSAQSNRLEGNVTVTVAARLANGNLLIRGEKRIALNRGEEYVRIQGIVRPADIGPDNSISSSRVADARIIYSGRGELAQSNAQGWLARFFDSVIHPF